MGKARAPAPPDYSGIANASKEAAEISANVAREQLAWAKEQYAKDKQVTDKVVDAGLARLAETDKNARDDRARWQTKYAAMEDQLIADANQSSDPAFQEQRAGGAAAEVSRQFDVARQAAQDQLESFGIDPSQTRAAALDLSSRTAEAAARASAANTAREQERAVGRGLRSEAINVGRGYPGQVASSYNTSIASGNQAANAALSQTATGANTMGTPIQWQSQSTGALGAWGSALSQGYNAQLAQFNANQNASSGIGSALGLIGGVGSALMFEEGGAVPEEASPSRGAIPDDVPALLQAGEFVIPEDAVRWVGEKHLQGLIQKSRQERETAPARGQMAAIPA